MEEREGGGGGGRVERSTRIKPLTTHIKARTFKPQARLEPALYHWWQARKADVLTTITPRVAPKRQHGIKENKFEESAWYTNTSPVRSRQVCCRLKAVQISQRLFCYKTLLCSLSVGCLLA